MQASFPDIEVTEFTFPSYGGLADIRAKQWMPPAGTEIRGIIQITHGMAEHIDRYDHLASFWASQGFAVCGQDNLGHGKSVKSEAEWGHMDPKLGKIALIENVHTLRGLMQEKLGDALPYFMYGHSMGSFIVRAYLPLHAEGLAGVILSGTGHQPGAVANGGLALAKAMAKTRGPQHRSSTLYGMAEGAYAKAIPNARTNCDWLSTDPALVDAYLADPACGFRFTAGGYIALMGLLSDLAKLKNLKKIPADLPIFLVAGADDPVGDKGRGVAQVFKEYKEAGLKNADMRLYLGMRHEIHNEVDKEKVYNDLLAWLEAHL